MNARNEPLTCKLTSADLRERRATVVNELKTLVIQKEDKANGYGYHFASDDHMLDKLVDFIKSERRCCPFFTFVLLVEDKSAILEITGPEGAKEFLDHEVGF